MQQEDASEYDKWISVVMTESGHSSMTGEVEKKEDLSVESRGGVDEPVSLETGERQVVAYIVQTDEQSFSGRSHITIEEQLEEVTDYEQVYVMSIELLT